MSVRWNGAGIPQSGELVELMDDSQSQTWGDVTIKFYGESFAVWDEHGEECSNSLCHVKVRPILTEAERKRDDFVKQIMQWMHYAGEAEIALIYDAIAAGKITGVRLSDD